MVRWGWPQRLREPRRQVHPAAPLARKQQQQIFFSLLSPIERLAWTRCSEAHIATLHARRRTGAYKGQIATMNAKKPRITRRVDNRLERQRGTRYRGRFS